MQQDDEDRKNKDSLKEKDELLLYAALYLYSFYLAHYQIYDYLKHFGNSFAQE
ncbi:hypothetical protein ACJX0J_007584, partial [Zea mays]